MRVCSTGINELVEDVWDTEPVYRTITIKATVAARCCR